MPGARDEVPGELSGHLGTQPDERLAASDTGAVLSRLVSCSAQTFADEHWGRVPLLSTADELAGDFSDLLDATVIDHLVSEHGLRTPFLRVAKNGTTLGNAAFTAGGGIGAGVTDQVSDDRLVDLFADGSTMVLQGLHRVWSPIIDFCQRLAAELGHPVQANAYVTPPQNQGFDDHYDVHDVFVLQIDGEKEWSIHEPVLPNPLRSQPWTDRRAAVAQAATAAPLIKTVLRPGDCLYLPRGYLHAARALGGVSTHLTIGVHSWTRYRLAEELLTATLARLADDQEVRESLAFGAQVADPEGLVDDITLVRERLVTAIQELPAEALRTRLSASARGAQRAAPIGPLEQLRAAETLRPDTRLRLRDHLQAQLLGPEHAGESGQFVLISRAGRLVISNGEAAALEPLLRGDVCTADQLGLDFSRRLLRAAVAVANA